LYRDCCIDLCISTRESKNITSLYAALFGNRIAYGASTIANR
jgi:hypothetical protein